MKRFIYITLAVVIVLGIAFVGLYFYTTSKSPFAVAQNGDNKLSVKVEYCQPSKKGREIFGKLVPYEKVWRTGANTSTTITFAQNTKIAGKEIKKGAYSLFTIPTPEKWTIIFNGVVGDWGAFSYKSEKDVLRVEVPASQVEKAREMFEIRFEKAENNDNANINMILAWDKTEVKVMMN